MTDNKNTIIAIALSALVLIVWQYFVGMPQQKVREEQQLQQQQKQVQTQPVQPGQPGTAPSTAAPSTTAPVAGAPAVPGFQQAPAVTAAATRADALRQSERVPISTGNLKGSIALKGGRIDDLSLVRFHEKVDTSSPPIVLLSPSGSPDPFYAEFGWTGGAAGVKLPNSETVWTRSGAAQ